MPPLLAATACLLPFIDKAFFVDDALFLRCAEHILQRPWDFFGFQTNWYGAPLWMFNITRNPPLACYYAALAALIGGWSEPAQHAAFLLPALAALAAVWRMARGLEASPWLAAGLTLATPAFIICSSAIMCDMMMVAFWCGAVWAWVVAHRSGRWAHFLLAGALASLSFLSKYFGVCLIPLLALYSLAAERRPGRWLVGLALPIACVLGYEALTARLYGHGLFLAAANYASQEKGGGSLLTRTLAGIQYLGGCVLPMALAAPLVWRPSRAALLAAGLAALGGVALWNGAALPTMTSLPPALAAHWLAFFVAGGLALAMAVAGLLRRRDPVALLLVAWAVGTVLFACLVNWTISGRNVLPAAPALGLAVARELAARGKETGKLWRWRIVAPAGVLALAFSLWVAWGDYAVANAQRELARRTHEKYGALGPDLLFVGHWGFQRYMEKAGHAPLELPHWRVRAGQMVAVPNNNTNVQLPPAGEFAVADEIVVPVGANVATMSWPRWAGFYSTLWGPLPYSLGRPRAERLRIYVPEPAN